jgi:hypothetical protein
MIQTEEYEMYGTVFCDGGVLFFKGLTSDIHLSIWKCVVPDHASDDKDSFKIDSHSFICLRL